MKLKFLILLTFTSFIKCFSQYGDNFDINYHKLEGKVKSLEQYSYDAAIKNGKIVKASDKKKSVKWDKDFKVNFDQNGNMLRKIFLDSLGNETWAIINTYDKKGNMTESISYVNQSIESKATAEYNEFSKLITRSRYYGENDKPYETQTYIYDENNRIKKLIIGGDIYEYFYSKKGVLNQMNRLINGNQLVQSTFYNDKEKIIKKLTYDYNKNITSTGSYIYDRNSNLINYTSIDGDGIIKNATETKYNNKNLVLEEIKYKGKKEVSRKEVSEYDKKGKLTLVINYNSKGKVTRKVKYEYDKKGNIIEHLTFFQNSETPDDRISYSYEFDKYNNWVTKNYLENDKPKYVFKRKISYY
tara:strand:- start:1544 stop:2614 length:1071 start_codon:yes stop_codon:yes gene_type:complete